jgi:hypothetical protein
MLQTQLSSKTKRPLGKLNYQRFGPFTIKKKSMSRPSNSNFYIHENPSCVSCFIIGAFLCIHHFRRIPKQLPSIKLNGEQKHKMERKIEFKNIKPLITMPNSLAWI